MADNEIRWTENANGVPQLRPCPFCGGKARLYPSEAGFFVGCFNDGCVINPCSGEFVYDGVWDEEQKEAAIKEWNTRAERTCHMECVPMFPDTDSHFLCWECSACRTTNDENRKPNYCPHCGAKVVE